jgi:hypothetical protein
MYTPRASVTGGPCGVDAVGLELEAGDVGVGDAPTGDGGALVAVDPDDP